VLRLLLACAPADGTPNRHACEAVLRHVWHGGLDVNDAARLAALQQQLAPRSDPASDAIKQQLRTSTAEAVALGIFGVPTIEADGRLFWGLDALDMLAGYLHADPWFDGPIGSQSGKTPPGVQR
jgi:2-hydroxychromene-2-carboxylate isomerase